MLEQIFIVEKHFGAWMKVEDDGDCERFVSRLRLFQGTRVRSSESVIH